MNFKSSLGILRITGILEGFSWLALLTTMTLKYGFEMPEPNVLVGKIHGFLFIGYVFMVFIVALDKKWGIKTAIWCLVASFLPFGTFVADNKILKSA
jgi:integral membrane protein